MINYNTFVFWVVCIATLCGQCQAADDITFFGDIAKLSSRSGEGTWSQIQEWAPDRLSSVSDPTSPGNHTVIQVEVQPGDAVGGWSGERAELAIMNGADGKTLPVTPATGHEFYALSVKLPPDWKAPVNLADPKNRWGIIFQLHGPDDLKTSPAFALCAENDFHVNLNTGDLSLGGTTTNTFHVISHSLGTRGGSLTLGKWVEFVLEVNWAVDKTGYLTLYRRDAGIAHWSEVLKLSSTPTLQYIKGQPVAAHYWKTGFYRSKSDFTSHLMLGPVARGNSFDAVVHKAFGQ